MNLDEFDDILKQKLGEIPMHEAVPDWDRMNKALEEDSMRDKMFDEQVSRKLQQIDVHQYARSNWNSLYALIEQRIQNKRRVLLAKTFEVVMVMLLLVTAVNMSVNVSDSKTPKSDNNEVTPMVAEVEFANDVDQVASAKSLDEGATSNNFRSVDSHVASDVSSSSSSSSSDSFLPVSDEATQSNGATSQQLASLGNVETAQIAKVDLSGISNAYNLVAEPSIHNGSIHEEQLQGAMHEHGTLSIAVVEDLDESTLLEAFPRDFRETELAQLNAPIALNSWNENFAPVLHATDVKNSRFFILAEVGSRENEIESAVHKSVANVRNGEVQNTSIKYSVNTFANVNLGYDFGPVALSSGLGFERIKYNPELVLATGSLSKIQETSIETIQYDFLSIPLELHLDVFEKGRWAGHFQVGFITNLLMSAKESFTQKVYRGNRVTISDPEDIDPQVFDFNFQEGYLTDAVSDEKPSFRSSLTYKAMVGAGISRKLTPKTSVFSRAAYIYQLPSANNLIDNNIDFINSFSLSVGVKQTLG